MSIPTFGYIDNFKNTIPKDLSNVKAVATGTDFVVALKEDGTVVSWGNNVFGQCDIPEGLNNVKAITVCYHTVAIKKDGTIVGFGKKDGTIEGFRSKNFLLSDTTDCTIEGIVSPDLHKLSGESPLKGGFKVEVVGMDLSTSTNPDGTFKISGIPKNSDGYTVRISKLGYLYRDIKNIIVESPYINIAGESNPIYLWAGDINQDNAINMMDITEIAEGFNTSQGNAKYKPDCDINKDGAINLLDVMIVAKHFNRSMDSYAKTII